MKWSGFAFLLFAVLYLVQANNSNENNEKESTESEETKNGISAGMFDDQLVKFKTTMKPNLEDDEDKSFEEAEKKQDGDSVSSDSDETEESLEPEVDEDTRNLDEYRNPNLYFDSQYRNQYNVNPNINADNWDYDKYYYYGQRSNDPTVYRKKRNMASKYPKNVLKRTPRKRAPLHTPLEQLLKVRNGLKRSTRMKRELTPYFQRKLSELLTSMALKEAKEEAEREKFFQSLPEKVQEQLIRKELADYDQGDREALYLQNLYPYQLPSYVTKQLREDAESENSDDMEEVNEEDEELKGDTEEDMPTFFRRPYQRRNDDTFYPAPNNYKWLFSGQKRSLSNGRWGAINDKRYSKYEEPDENEDDVDQIDPAKLFLFASLLDGEDEIEDRRSSLRKRLIL